MEFALDVASDGNLGLANFVGSGAASTPKAFGAKNDRAIYETASRLVSAALLVIAHE